MVTNHGFTEIALGIGGTIAGIKIGGGIAEAPGSIGYGAIGGYLGLKLGQKYLGLNRLDGVRQHFLTASLSAISSWTYSGSLAQRCNSIPSDFFCSILSYGRPLIATATGVSLLYSIYISRKKPWIHRWVVNDKEVRIVHGKGHLRNQIIDTKTNIVQEGPLEFGELSIKKQIEYLKGCEVMVGADGSPFFSKPLLRNPHFDQEVSLLKDGNKLTWQIYDKKKRRAEQVSFNKIKFQPMNPSLSDVCNSLRLKNIEMDNRISEFKRKYKKREVPTEKCLSFLDEFHINGAEVVEKNEKKELRIKLLPDFDISFFDEKVIITKKTWSVTLICAKGCQSSDGDNHAEIIIEGIKKEGHFLKFAHLVRRDDPKDVYGRVKIQKGNPLNLNFSGRTQMWEVPERKVRKMLKAIKEDRLNPPKLKWNAGSVLSKKDEENCFTWARKKLEICGIHIEKKYLEWIVSVTSLYTPVEKYITF